MNTIQSENIGTETQLSAMLEGYECPAILVSVDYIILACNTAYKAAFGDLQLSTRPNCYRISHGYSVPCDQAGESCPLVAAKNSKRKERVLHIHQTPHGKEHVDVEMLPIFDDKGDLLFFIELLHPVPLASGNINEQQMLGSSPAFSKLLESISRVSSTDASVLLVGESGTGKELAARAIHMASKRNNKPMVTLECAGLSDSLFESELFGHVKGSFTGASSNKVGLIELADGGTLFLDEIADIPLSMQIKLLRLLESGSYRQVGSTEARTSDFRLILATHKDLPNMVEEGAFRQDLYYRINVFPIQLPPLSQRRDDIPQIAKSLLRRVDQDATHHLTQSAMELLKSLHYKGNIRELRNIIARALVLADTNVIDKTIIEKCIDTVLKKQSVINEQKNDCVDLKTAEKRHLEKLTSRYSDKQEMAKIAGISLRSLYRKLSFHGIK